MKKLLALLLLGMIWGCGPKSSEITAPILTSDQEAVVAKFIAEHPNPGVAHKPGLAPNADLCDGAHGGRGDVAAPFDGCVSVEDFYAEYYTVWHKVVAFAENMDINCDGVVNDLDVYLFAQYNGGEFGADPTPIPCQL